MQVRSAWSMEQLDQLTSEQLWSIGLYREREGRPRLLGEAYRRQLRQGRAGPRLSQRYRWARR